jgi:hypothetical protein
MQALTANTAVFFLHNEKRPLTHLRKGPSRWGIIAVHQSSHLWLKEAARNPEKRITPSTAIKTCIFAIILNLHLINQLASLTLII